MYGVQTTQLEKIVQEKLPWSGYVEKVTVDRIQHNA